MFSTYMNIEKSDLSSITVTALSTAAGLAMPPVKAEDYVTLLKQ
ncbi:hypothetical protein HanIR_Chr07g0304191 [Helianthus annuus]|nr:hypothetical protein HanIR_Chr07g0304191 [Helianthus annuus]